MLVIQEVNLTWHKAERGGVAADARRRFPLAYPLGLAEMCRNVWLNRLDYFQQGEDFWDLAEEIRRHMPNRLKAMGFEQPEIERRVAHHIRQLRKNENQFFNAADELNLPNLALEYCGDNLQVSFAYDERRSGQPRRCGHNKDFHKPHARLYAQDLLNETAFLLAPDEYGRLIWNERNIDCDTGAWYYQLHIYNIFRWQRGMPPQNVFLAREPDFVYEQLAKLF